MREAIETIIEKIIEPLKQLANGSGIACEADALELADAIRGEIRRMTGPPVFGGVSEAAKPAVMGTGPKPETMSIPDPEPKGESPEGLLNDLEPPTDEITRQSAKDYPD